jgi:hypothetical protein
MTERHYVKVDRDDGSRTYKGPWTQAHCEREASAWRESFPTYGVELVPVAEARGDVRKWAAVTRNGSSRYFPE